MGASPSDRRCALFIHAHPDDEASKGSGTVARGAAMGVRNVLICCTGGEAGDILNAAADTPEIRGDLGGARLDELRESVRVLGYAQLYLLGYHDSGMPDSATNARADNFWNADPDEAVGRLVAIIRRERPQVMVVYGDDRGRYPHPDHIRVHEWGVAAYEAAGDPSRYPQAGDPWHPAKLYFTGFWSRERVIAMHQWFVERGEESPYQRFMEAIVRDDDESSKTESSKTESANNESSNGRSSTDQTPAVRFTTRVDVGDYMAPRRASLLAHKTQVDPDGFWLRIPDDVMAELFPWEEYVLERSTVSRTRDDWEEGTFEHDLFEGISTDATQVTLAR